MQMSFWGKDFLNFDMRSLFLSRQQRWKEPPLGEMMREEPTEYLSEYDSELDSEHSAVEMHSETELYMERITGTKK